VDGEGPGRRRASAGRGIENGHSAVAAAERSSARIVAVKRVLSTKTAVRFEPFQRTIDPPMNPRRPPSG